MCVSVVVNHKLVVHLVEHADGRTLGNHGVAAEGHIAGDEVHDFLSLFRRIVLGVVNVLIVNADGVDDELGVLLVDAFGACAGPGVVMGVDKKDGAGRKPNRSQVPRKALNWVEDPHLCCILQRQVPPLPAARPRRQTWLVIIILRHETTIGAPPLADAKNTKKIQ